jgi:hypothetical protein
VAVAGLAWDVRPYATLGLEAGWSSRPWEDAPGGLVWLGGRDVPLVTFHLGPLDAGLQAALAWDDGEAGVLAGFAVLLTL